MIGPLEEYEQSRKLRLQADTVEASAIVRALAFVGGNVRQAADLLQIPAGTLTTMLRTRLAHLKPKTTRRLGRPKKS